MQASFFDAHLEICHERLEKAGDPLVKLAKMIDWQGLRGLLKPITVEGTAKGGRPAFDALLMVKILILQSLYNIADGSCEYQINDRLSFKRFLGLAAGDKAPDEKTIWLYRERVKHSNLHEKIFSWFNDEITKAGYKAQEGQIVDATFVPTHKPTGKQDKQLKEGVSLTPAQMAQRDGDASFTKKGDATHHGYKNHVNVDAAHKFILKAITTTAKTHDSQALEEVLTAGNGAAVYGDSAYRSEKIETMLAEKGLESKVHERAYRNTPLSAAQKATNKILSSIRARVEHVFGYMETVMHGMMIHTIGLARATVKNTFKNIAYNMRRFVCLENQKISNAIG
jgi:transposase, IS5 family